MSSTVLNTNLLSSRSQTVNMQTSSQSDCVGIKPNFNSELVDPTHFKIGQNFWHVRNFDRQQFVQYCSPISHMAVVRRSIINCD